MADLLFDTPWWLPTALLAAGVILFLSGNKRTMAGLRNAGVALVVLGVLVAVVSYFVDTDKETVVKRSSQLVHSAGEQDWKAVESLMSPTVQFHFTGRNYVDRATLIDSARTTAQAVGLSRASTTSVEPKQDGASIKTTMRVFSDQQKTGGQPLPSDWELQWDKVGGQWVVSEIRLIQVGQMAASDIRDQLPKGGLP